MSLTSYLSSLLGSRLPIAPMPVAPTTPSPQMLEAFTATAELVPTQGEAVVHTPTGRQPSLWSRFVAAVMGVKATITSFFARTPEPSAVHGLRDMTVEVMKTPPAAARSSQERIDESVAAAVREAFAGCEDHDRIVATATRQASSMATRSLRLSHAAELESGQLPDGVVSQAVAKATAQVREILYVASVEALSRQTALARPLRSEAELVKRFDEEVQRAWPKGQPVDAAALARVQKPYVERLTTLMWAGQARGQDAQQAALDALEAYRLSTAPTAAAPRIRATGQTQASAAAQSLAEQEAQFERLYARAVELEAQLKARDSQAPGDQ